MKFAVIGSGAVGSYYAGVLKRSNNEVYLLSRGKNLETIRDKGLRVITDKTEFIVRPDLASNLADDFPKVEVVIVAVKAWQVRDILPRSRKIGRREYGDNSLAKRRGGIPDPEREIPGKCNGRCY